jgi:hypothetical protein
MVSPSWVGLPTDSTMLGHHRIGRPPGWPGNRQPRLAEGLQIEAVAEDGLIDDARSAAHRFLVGVQWHPEWRVADNPSYHSIFHAFGDACRRNSLTADRS